MKLTKYIHKFSMYSFNQSGLRVFRKKFFCTEDKLTSFLTVIHATVQYNSYLTPHIYMLHSVFNIGL